MQNQGSDKIRREAAAVFQSPSSQCWDLGLSAELMAWALSFKWKTLDAGGQVMHMWGMVLHSTALSLP